MGNFSTGNVLVKNNPFIFYQDSEDMIETGNRQDYPNPLRAIFDDLAPLLFESDPSTRYPQEFSGDSHDTWCGSEQSLGAVSVETQALRASELNA